MRSTNSLAIIFNLVIVSGSLAWVASCGGVHLNNPSLTSGVLTIGAASSDQNALVAMGLNNPNRVYSDGTRLFIGDTGNNRVLIYNQIPTTNLVLPDVVLGQPNSSSNSLIGGVNASTLNAPQGMCVSGNKLFVADTGNNRVLVWNSIPTTTGQGASLVLGQTDMFTNTASVSQTPLNRPFDVVCNANFLWVLDTGGHVSTFAISGLRTNALANPILTPTSTPGAMALDSTHLLVGTAVNIQIWNISDPAVAPTSSTANAVLSLAVNFRGLYSDGTNIWFTEQNNRVVTYAGYTTATITIGTNTGLTIGQTTPTGTAIGNSGSTVNGPRGIYGDAANLYIADSSNNRVLIHALPSVPISPPTAYTTSALVAVGQGSFVLGSTVPVVSAPNSPISARLLNAPNQGFSDGTHLIVADTGNNRVLIWNTIPPSSGTSADIVLGQGGNFFIRGIGTDASSGNNSYLSGPRGVFSDGTHLFVADTGNNRVLVWTTFPTSSTSAPNFVVGQADFTTVTSGVTSSKMNFVTAVSADSQNLYVSDTTNKRLLIYPLAPLLSAGTNGQAATYALGATDLASVGLGIGQHGFSPQGSYSDGARLFVSDTANNRVLVWNRIPAAHLTAADVVIGQPGFYSNGANLNSDGSIGPSGQTCSSPHGAIVLGSKLYLADSSNSRILVWNNIPTSNTQGADSVIGQTSLFSANLNTVSLSSSTLNNPFALSSQDIYLIIADRDNNRVLFIVP